MYVLEASEKTKEAAGEMEGSFHHVTLQVILLALKRFVKSSDITIYVNNEFIKNSIKLNMDTWIANDFTRSNGKPLANREQWQQLHIEMQKHEHVELKTGNHAYTKWMQDFLKGVKIEADDRI